MENELQELESILKQELSLHCALYETSQQFNSAIKENDLDLMQKYTTEQDERICSIERLEETRNDCCLSLSKYLNFTPKEVKLSSFLEAIPLEWKKRLSQLQQSLKQTICKLTKMNTSNRILLEEANAIINKTFDMIQHSQDHLQPYSSKGKIPARRSGCALYNNIV